MARFRRRVAAPAFDRSARIDALVQLLDEFADLSEPPAMPDDALLRGQLAGQAARRRNPLRTESVARPRLRSARSGPHRTRPEPRTFKTRAKGSGKLYRSGVLRDDVSQARENLQSALAGFEADANADLAAALRQRAARLRCSGMKRKSQGRRARLSRPPAQGARSDPGRRQRCARAFSSASSGSSSMSSRTPIRCRPRSCCCWPPTIRLRRTGAKLARFRGSSSSSAIRSSRSIASGAPTSAFIAACTRCCRRRAPEA